MDISQQPVGAWSGHSEEAEAEQLLGGHGSLPSRLCTWGLESGDRQFENPSTIAD